MYNIKTFTYKLFAVTLLINSQAFADETNLFLESKPSAQTMGKILFAKNTPMLAAPRLYKTRSISFGQVQQPVTQNTTSASVGLPIKFAYNSAEILASSITYVEEIGKMLNLNEYKQEKIIIEGHTDAVGSSRYNQRLSEQRADAVKQYLLAYYQVAPERLFIIGKGESNPLPDRSRYDAANRRVQLYQAR